MKKLSGLNNDRDISRVWQEASRAGRGKVYRPSKGCFKKERAYRKGCKVHRSLQEWKVSSVKESLLSTEHGEVPGPPENCGSCLREASAGQEEMRGTKLVWKEQNRSEKVSVAGVVLVEGG